MEKEAIERLTNAATCNDMKQAVVWTADLRALLAEWMALQIPKESAAPTPAASVTDSNA